MGITQVVVRPVLSPSDVEFVFVLLWTYLLTPSKLIQFRMCFGVDNVFVLNQVFIDSLELVIYKSLSIGLDVCKPFQPTWLRVVLTASNVQNCSGWVYTLTDDVSCRLIPSRWSELIFAWHHSLRQESPGIVHWPVFLLRLALFQLWVQNCRAYSVQKPPATVALLAMRKNLGN